MVLFNVTRWPAPLVFLLAGGAGVVLAFATVNLVSQAMASLRFVRDYGAEAIRHGALWQVGHLLLLGTLSLGCWLVFKICEQELEDRYFRWARNRAAPDGALPGDPAGKDG